VFAIVFTCFIVAMAVLCVLIIRWAIRRDMQARRQRNDVSHNEGEVGG
jgi:hypothetical protein